jgi:hypothetical protein
MHRTLLVATACVTACAPALAPAETSGDPIEFAPATPDIDAGAPLVHAPWGTPDVPRPDASVGQPVVEPGLWTMEVLSVRGQGCWDGIEVGATLDVEVSVDGSTMRLLDTVTLHSEGDGRAVGVGSAGGEIAEGCRETDSLFATAAVHGPERFEASFEHARTYAGETCRDLEAPPMNCTSGWVARFSWTDTLVGDTGGR